MNSNYEEDDLFDSKMIPVLAWITTPVMAAADFLARICNRITKAYDKKFNETGESKLEYYTVHIIMFVGLLSLLGIVLWSVFT